MRQALAHCDLFCGVYDPAQARIEAQSVLNAAVKSSESTDDYFKQRALVIKEQRAELVKHHLWVLWTDYFKQQHIDEFPDLHNLFWLATKAAGDAKKSNNIEVCNTLIELVDKIGYIFEQTKDGYNYEAVVKNCTA